MLAQIFFMLLVVASAAFPLRNPDDEANVHSAATTPGDDKANVHSAATTPGFRHRTTPHIIKAHPRTRSTMPQSDDDDQDDDNDHATKTINNDSTTTDPLDVIDVIDFPWPQHTKKPQNDDDENDDANVTKMQQVTVVLPLPSATPSGPLFTRGTTEQAKSEAGRPPTPTPKAENVAGWPQTPEGLKMATTRKLMSSINSIKNADA